MCAYLSTKRVGEKCCIWVNTLAMLHIMLSTHFVVDVCVIKNITYLYFYYRHNELSTQWVVDTMGSTSFSKWLGTVSPFPDSPYGCQIAVYDVIFLKATQCYFAVLFSINSPYFRYFTVLITFLPLTGLASFLV